MNTHLQYAGFIYVLYIAVFFFLKKKVNSLENKLYGGLIIHTILMFIPNFGSRVTPTYFDLSFPPITILTKVNFCLTMAYFIRFSYYLFVMTSNKHVELTDISEHPNLEYFNKKAILKRIAIVISCILMLALPFEIAVEGKLIFLTGPVIKVRFIIMTLCILSWIIMMLTTKNKSKKLNFIYFYIALGIIMLILQATIEGVDFIATYIGLLTVLIYNTIENPDVNLIRQLNTAKIEAEEANKSKTEFLSRMSHEIRTPLNAIVGFGQVLIKEDISESAKEDAKDIIMASNTLLDIVNGILDIQRIENNKIEISNDNYSTKRMINEVSSLINARIGSKPIDFKVLVDEKLPQILYGDVIRIKQVMINILTNAIKYTDEGRILLQIKANNENGICNMTIEVADTGIGMTEESLANLFNQYQRFDEEKNLNIEGTGLGLAITKGLIELMDGEINVKSKYGEGSTFIINLKQKIIDSEIELDLNEPEETVKTFNAAGSKVLVVDDNKINIKVAERLLKEYNIEVESVYSGAESIDKVLSGNKYDIIFMDIMMPKMNGVEALEKLKSIIGFDMPVVALTADVISGMEEKYISQGFDDCLAKPIVEEELYYMLKKFLNEVEEPTVTTIPTPTVVESTPKVEEIPVTAPVETPAAPVETPAVVEEIELPAIAVPTIEAKPSEEKITPKVEETPAPVVEQPVTINNPELTGVELLEANNINVKAGLELLKDMEMYEMTLEEFYNELQNKLNDLTEYKESGNMEDYAILAHALKTEARYVGCNELGDMAYEHELAGKASNQEEINQKFDTLKTEVNRVYVVVKKYFNN